MPNDTTIRSSQTHPLRIDAVQPWAGWGQIGMSLCPGKWQPEGLSGHWQRDLALDLDRIREGGGCDCEPHRRP